MKRKTALKNNIQMIGLNFLNISTSFMYCRPSSIFFLAAFAFEAAKADAAFAFDDAKADAALTLLEAVADTDLAAEFAFAAIELEFFLAVSASD